MCFGGVDDSEENGRGCLAAHSDSQGLSCQSDSCLFPPRPIAEKAQGRRCLQGMTGFNHNSVSCQEAGLTADENEI